MNEIVDFIKELLLLKEEKFKPAGLSAFRKPIPKVAPKIIKKRVKKEKKLSELMRKI